MCFFSWRCLGMSSTIFLQFWLWCFFVRFVLGACYFSLACGKPPQKKYLKLPVVVRMNHETKTDIDHFQTHENYGSMGCLDPSVCLPLPHGKPTISFSIGDGCSPGQVDVFVFFLHWCFFKNNGKYHVQRSSDTSIYHHTSFSVDIWIILFI